MDPAHEAPHIGRTPRKFLWIQVPVAYVRLPAVIDHCPGQAQILHLWQRTFDQLYGARSLITPRAPDRLKGSFRRLRRAQPPLAHDASIGIERFEVVAPMGGHEGLERLEGLPGRECLLALRVDVDSHGAAVFPDRQCYQLRLHRPVSDGAAAVASP